MTDLIERLRDGCVLRPKRWSGDTHDDLGGSIDEAATDALLREAAAALEAAREDAQRWQWIRENYSRITVTSAFNREHGYGKFTTAAGTFETIDAAVDAAIDQARGKGVVE